MRKLVIIVMCVLYGSLAGLAGAQGPGEDESAVWTAQEIRLLDEPGEVIAILENGLTVIVRENHTAPVAAVRLYVRAGSIYEQEHLGAGLSHLFEHLLSGGTTTTRSEDESRQMIEEIGARSNAHTSKAFTCYYLTVPAQHVATAVNLIADWVTRPTFPDDEFDREWAVVQRELEMNASDPRRKQWKLFDELRYKVHPGRYPIIGHQAIVQALSRDDIMAYYKKMYVPDNMVFSVVGHVNAEEMLSKIKAEFADFTRRGRVEVVLPSEPAVTAERRIVQVFPPMRGPAKLMIGFPSFELQHEDLYALDTLANIMGSGRSSRLYRKLHDEQELVLNVWAANHTPHWAKGTFIVACTLSPDKVAAAEQGVWEVIEQIAKDGVTEKELARAKRQLQGEHIRNNQTAEQQAATMATDLLATGDAHFSDDYVAKMQQVSAEVVQQMAGKYLDAQKQMTLVLTGTELPSEASEATAKQTETDIRMLTLENGLRVLLKHNPDVPLVSMQLYVMGGLLEETDENNGLTNFMARLSTKGTKSYTAEEIAEYFDSIGGVLGATAGNNTFFYTAEVIKEDFAEAFGVYSEVVLEPSFPDDELEKLRKQLLAAIAQQENSWQVLGGRFFRKSFFSKSPYQRTRLGTAEGVGKLTREQIVQFHKSGTVGTRAVLAVFGDIDMTVAESLVREKFSPMPKGDRFDLERFAAEPVIAAPREFKKQTDKTGAVIHVGYPGLRLSDIKDRNAMEVMAQIVGSNSGWLHETLRGAGLVYYAWLVNQMGLLPGSIYATAQCEVDKTEEVLSLIQQKLAEAARGEFTEKEVARAKSNNINSEVLGKQTNASAAAAAALDELYGFGYDWSKGNADRIMAVTLADVQRVAAKYLSAPATTTIVSSSGDKAE